MKSFEITENDLREIFAEWERRRRESPDDFNNLENMINLTVEEYAKRVAKYFIELHETII